ncbi:MAG: hypothetical protein AAFW69_07085 [Pseudomonadota bacterium]
METLIGWLGTYSPGVVAVLVTGGALLWLIREVTKGAVAAEFDRLTKAIELRLERRSAFEERVMLDRYAVAGDLHMRIVRVMTDLNRHRSGTPVEGLFSGRDIVPLTDVYERLEANRYLLPEGLHRLLVERARLVLAIANAPDAAALEALTRDYAAALSAFHREMDRVFGLSGIDAAAPGAG